MTELRNLENRITPTNILDLDPNQVFVFGSNLAGAHGAGAARTALRWGAKYGLGSGMSGMTYAIPTKDHRIQTLPLMDIFKEIDIFLKYAETVPYTFLVTAIGCGLAGYTPSQIAPFFTRALVIPNVWLPSSFWNIIKTQVSHSPINTMPQWGLR